MRWNQTHDLGFVRCRRRSWKTDVSFPSLNSALEVLSNSFEITLQYQKWILEIGERRKAVFISLSPHEMRERNFLLVELGHFSLVPQQAKDKSAKMPISVGGVLSSGSTSSNVCNLCSKGKDVQLAWLGVKLPFAKYYGALSSLSPVQTIKHDHLKYREIPAAALLVSL